MKPIPDNPNLPPATFPTIGFGEVAKSDIKIPKITKSPGDLVNPLPTMDNKLQASQEEYGASDEPCFANNRGAAQSHNIRTSEEWFTAAMETSDEDSGYGAQDEVVILNQNVHARANAARLKNPFRIGWNGTTSR